MTLYLAINFIINHFKTKVRSYYHHCGDDYIIKIIEKGKLIFSGNMNSECGDFNSNNLKDKNIYELNLAEFEIIQFTPSKCSDKFKTIL